MSNQELKEHSMEYTYIVKRLGEQKALYASFLPAGSQIDFQYYVQDLVPIIQVTVSIRQKTFWHSDANILMRAQPVQFGSTIVVMFDQTEFTFLERQLGEANGWQWFWESLQEQQDLVRQQNEATLQTLDIHTLVKGPNKKVEVTLNLTVPNELEILIRELADTGILGAALSRLATSIAQVHTSHSNRLRVDDANPEQLGVYLANVVAEAEYEATEQQFNLDHILELDRKLGL
jgi:hypothetical protein